MTTSPDDRRYLVEQIRRVTDDRAADVMSQLFDEQDEPDPGIVARFDQMDARFADIDRRFEEVDRRFDAVDARFDAMEERFDLKSDALRHELVGVFRGELNAAITAQTKTLVFGMLGAIVATLGGVAGLTQLM